MLPTYSTHKSGNNDLKIVGLIKIIFHLLGEYIDKYKKQTG